VTPEQRQHLAHWASDCHEEVIRKGLAEPCEKPAVAARYDPGDGAPYPVCSRHARRPMVPLSQLLGAP
jgi:hypothetical protein